ncbi:class I adenylate-forming enzyme family protein [Hydrogenophaga aquatica]
MSLGEQGTNETSPLTAALTRRVRLTPDATALRFTGRSYSYANFWRRVERVTGHLQSLLGHSLERRHASDTGPRVAWLGMNHELQLATLFACARVGAVFMPLNFRLAVPELRDVLNQAQPGLLVHDDACHEAAQALQTGGWQTRHHDALIQTPSPRGLPLPAVDGQTPVLLVYTSGTSGHPKGAIHTQHGLLANARASEWAHQFTPDDHVLSALPMFHVGGLCIQTLPALLAGLPVSLLPRFEPGTWLKAVRELRPSLSLLVPATLRAVIDHPDWNHADLSSLRGIMTGSSTIPLAYLRAFHERGIPVGQIYGSTETGPVSICLPLDDAIEREGAAGWPAPDVEVKLLDNQGSEVPQGQAGEICLRAPNLMRGYWNTQNPTPGQGLRAGWFHSGDLGVRAQDGCISVVGRSKDMIISGGENIYPAEIENQLVTLPGVSECAVIGMDDARWGEVPVAAIVRSDDPAGAALSEALVMAHLQARIARFKLPRKVVFLQALPKSALGKIQKTALRASL